MEKYTSADTANLTFEQLGGNKEVNVKSNEEWTATSNSSPWCTVAPSSGKEDGVIYVIVNENTTTAVRIATIEITGKLSGANNTVLVEQVGIESTLSVETRTIELSCLPADMLVAVSSYEDWMPYSNSDWCSVGKDTTDTEELSLAIHVDKNWKNSRRNAIILLRGQGSGKTVQIELIQKGMIEREEYGEDHES